MVTSDGHVKISDFGIAKATTELQTGAFLTATGMTVGTPHYMAPEQAMAQPVGPWTDLYPLGCMASQASTSAGAACSKRASVNGSASSRTTPSPRAARNRTPTRRTVVLDHVHRLHLVRCAVRTFAARGLPQIAWMG
jgi:serine/threonine protein kinase